MTTATDNQTAAATDNATANATTPKPDPIHFESREERENYYRWIYCVKNGITDMETYGVKPLGMVDSASPAVPVSPVPPSNAPRRSPGASKANAPLQLEMSKPMVFAFLTACKLFNLFGGAIWLAWQFCAVVTAVVILAAIIGVMTA